MNQQPFKLDRTDDLRWKLRLKKACVGFWYAWIVFGCLVVAAILLGVVVATCWLIGWLYHEASAYQATPLESIRAGFEALIIFAIIILFCNLPPTKRNP